MLRPHGTGARNRPTIPPVSDVASPDGRGLYRSWVDRMLEGFRAEPDSIVVRDASRELTGGEFAAMVDRYALGPRRARAGLRRPRRPAGHRVAEALAVRYAVALVGAASVFTPDTGRPERLVRFLKQVRPRLLVVFPETAPHAQAAAARVLSDETVAVGPVDGLADLAAEAAPQADAPVRQAAPARRPRRAHRVGGDDRVRPRPACAASTHTPPCSATAENRTESC